MVENNPKTPAAVDADDALMRFVIDTARDDVPSLGAKARLLGSSALTSTARKAARPRSLLVRILGARAGYGFGLAVLAAGGAAFVSITHGRSARPAAPVVSAVTVELAEPAPVVASPPPPVMATTDVPPNSSPTPTTVPVARPRAHAPSHVPPKMSAEVIAMPHADFEPSSTLDREIARIADVRAELAKGDGARALVLLDSYDTEFPSGAFALDVTVLRIEALARCGRTEEARRLGERFLAAHPRSASARRVTVTLQGIAPTDDDSAAAAAPH